MNERSTGPDEQPSNGSHPLQHLGRNLAEVLDADYDPNRVLCTDDPVSGGDCFFATGITGGELVRGVPPEPGGCSRHLLVMCTRRGTDREIASLHNLNNLRAHSAVDFLR